MRRLLCLLLLGCFLGCGGSPKAPPAVFDANSLEPSFLWMQRVYDQVRNAEEQGNKLLVAEAEEKAQQDLKKLEGTTIQWSLNVHEVRPAAAGDPEFPEAEGKPPTGYVVVLEAPGYQKAGEEGDVDTLHLYFSRGKTPQENQAYLIHLDEKDRDYARTLTRGMPVEVSAVIQSIQSYYDDNGAGFLLKLTEAQLVR